MRWAYWSASTCLLTWSIITPVQAADLWGAVSAVQGYTALLLLQDDTPSPTIGSMVEITTSAFGEELVIGEWRVKSVQDDGTVVVAPVNVLTKPERGMRAVIHTSCKSPTEMEE